jgi:putative DNA primase/helicase
VRRIKTGRQTARSVSVLDFLAMDLPPRQWLVEGLIQERDITMLHAWRGVGKTHFVGHLAWAVASGTSFLRYEVPKPAGVLLVDGEMPREDLKRRFSDCAHSFDVEPKAPFRLLCGDVLPDEIPSLATPEGQTLIEAELNAFPEVRLLILDSISTLCNVAPAENDAESWTGMQQWLLKLRRRGVSPLIVHHDGKGGAQRGTSKREDVVSQSIHLKRPSDYNASQGARFEVVLEKASSEKLLAMLQSGIKLEAAYKELGLSRATAFRFQKRWREEGKLPRGVSQVSYPKGLGDETGGETEPGD